MLDAKAVGVSVKLMKNAKPADNAIYVSAHPQLVVTAGDYYYIQIQQGTSMERMKVIAMASTGSNFKLQVERGVDSTTAKEFFTGACVSVEWTPAQLCEFVKNCLSNAADSVITPGTYCLSCDTCITVNGSGNITAIDGEKRSC